MLEIKNIVTEVKDTFDGQISRLAIAEERILELEDLSIETDKTKKQRKKDKKQTNKKTKNRISKDYETSTKV